MNEMQFEIISGEISAFLAIVRCAAHTLQLVCHDVFKDISEDIEEVRNMVKIVRKHIKNENKDIQMPLLDTPTRWNSTYEMVKSVQNNKNIFDELLKDDINWSFITKFLTAFKPLSSSTVKAQSENYILGDFYRDWLCTKVDVEEESLRGNIYSKKILVSMNSREKKIMENVSFKAALYMDPRFNFHETPFLSLEEKNAAMVNSNYIFVTLETIYRRKVKKTHTNT